MSDETSFPAKQFGRPYPTGYLVAWFSRRDQADAAAADLRGAGFDEIRVLTGQEAIGLSRGIAEGLGPLGRILRKLSSDEGELEAEYLSAAEEEATLLAVRAPTQDQTTAADEILVRHGAHARHKYGRLTVKRLM